MTSSIAHITFDCGNAADLAAFWSGVTGWSVDPDGSEFFTTVGGADKPPGAPLLMFIQVPEAKTAKNRCHLDLGTKDREAEVERLVGLGATLLHEGDEFGVRWTTLADPEGNEFCVGSGSTS
jgi:predicted enzyme related to lactoylglutathione lyase